MSRLVIIDGNAIIHRAYHALPPMTTKDGLVVNAVYGFLSMLLKVIKDVKPTHVAATFDMSGPTFRHEKYKEYKATRVKADQALYDQIPLVHEAVEAFGIPIYEKKGYEADDVIGTIVEEIKKKKVKGKSVDETEVFIVTGDMDTLQLIQPGVKVFTLRQGMNDVVVYGPEEVKVRFGFGPERMVDYKAIRGDTSDNIPGVPGIGEKGATDLIVKVGDLDTIYKKIEKLKDLGFKNGLITKLKEGKDSAYMSKDLATIDRAVPKVDFVLGDAVLKPFEEKKIVPILQKFEFVSLIKRVPGLNGVGTAAANKENKTEGKAKKKKTEFIFKEFTTEGEGKNLATQIAEAKTFACRAVLEGKDIFSGQLTALVVVAGETAAVLSDAALDAFLPVFENKTLTLVGHDLKQLFKVLSWQKKVVIKNQLFDAMIASYLLSSGSRAHDVASILLKELGEMSPSASGQNSLFGVDKRALANELWLLNQAAEKLRANLLKADNLGLFQKMEMPVLIILAEMELNGVALDKDKIADIAGRVKKDLAAVSKKIYGYAGQEFNISSPLQLREILFEKLEIPVDGIKKGKTGLSTSAEELQKMKGLHPIIDEIETYRELAKLENTYLDVLPTLVNPVTHRIHTTFNQAVAATGRLSSTDPNLQNIPARTAIGREIREAFVAEKGNVLVSADYSQIELRIVASLAEDKKMMEIFAAGEDIHTATAAAINGVPIDKVTKDMRRAAKEINFGILYGMGTYGLAWRAEIPAAQAKAFIAKYFSEFSGVKKYIDTTLEFTKKEGYCETLFGRRRHIPELNATNYQVRAGAERMAINHPIQGTAADLMKMGMIAVKEKLSAAGLKPDVRMTLQVHDELVLEAKPEQVPQLVKLLKEAMEGVVKLRVPVEVHVSSGKSWGEME